MNTKEALQAIKSPDRNVRVRALRAVFSNGQRDGVDVVLAGLSDDKRRVREVALKAAKPFLDQAAVAERIAAMVEDENEKQRIRGMALLVLGGALRTPYLDRVNQMPEAAMRALKSLAEADRYRDAVLRRLLFLDLTPAVEELLKEYVRSGTKEEAVAATRALCGYRLVNWGSAKPAELAAAGAVRADGVHYWVRRDAKLGAPTD